MRRTHKLSCKTK